MQTNLPLSIQNRLSRNLGTMLEVEICQCIILKDGTQDDDYETMIRKHTQVKHERSDKSIPVFIHVLTALNRILMKRLISCKIKLKLILYTKQIKLRLHMSRLMGKPTICTSENKDADQLRGNREADQRLCFRNTDSTIPLLLKSEISSF